MVPHQWQRLSEREQGIAPDTTHYEGVPGHLVVPLRNWIEAAMQGGDAERVAVRLRVPTGPPESGSASEQIRHAWGAVYGLHPNPEIAYSQAIKAVESAAAAIVEPNNSRATLGTMLRQLRATPSRYGLAIPGPDVSGNIGPLINMIELLWTGQTSRHGGQTAMRSETQDEADMAVYLAITLVRWFTSGAVRRRQ